ncbi:Zinc finger CCCH domain-containing protein 11A [Frankliniella fusca]|uniref:Zinc finger CCCH domain-containing protein 11A n=1 Tax=Frankliniella fusca TaxID=407009 RepID=A0AAE1HMM9_9NEOP|nr:Zinc finger CCCH domain-containing protein 11A [Frankliniella fusca]
MTMDQKSKNIDCYFYYYSECVRGNSCKFRHEPSALGCEDMCMKWKEGNCTEPHCSQRHMELKKKRKEIPCYWERQPGGCRKAHCAFKHQLKGNQAQSDSLNSPETSKKESDSSAPDWQGGKMDGASNLDSGVEPPVSDSSRRLSHGVSDSYNSSPAAVDPIVVNFEEESDSESAPSWTPTKVPKEKDSLHVKTLEEIRLEKIQAESAAYWEGIAGGPMAWEAANPAANPSASPCSAVACPRKPCVTATISYKKAPPQGSNHIKNVTKELDFRVLSLDEIRKNRARKTDANSTIQKEEHSHNSSSNVTTNGFSSSDFRAHLGITDLRAKLCKVKTDGYEIQSCSDTWSTKRQRQQTSSHCVPSKKQRVRQTGRLSDLIAQRTSVRTTQDDEERGGLCEEADIDGHIIGDIDRLLMD